MNTPTQKTPLAPAMMEYGFTGDWAATLPAKYGKPTFPIVVTKEDWDGAPAGQPVAPTFYTDLGQQFLTQQGYKFVFYGTYGANPNGGQAGFLQQQGPGAPLMIPGISVGNATDGNWTQAQMASFEVLPVPAAIAVQNPTMSDIWQLLLKIAGKVGAV